MSEAIVEVKNLCKSYGKIKAVDDISFKIYKGEIFGLVGHSWAEHWWNLIIILGLLVAGAIISTLTFKWE